MSSQASEVAPGDTKALEFYCPECHSVIVVRYLKAGELACCKACGALATVPADATRVAAPQRIVATGSSAPVPDPPKMSADELKQAQAWQEGFNLGAFVLTPLWLLFHGKAGMGFLLILLNLILPFICAVAAAATGSPAIVFLPLLIGLLIMLYYGANGHRLAWEDRGTATLTQVKKRERGWATAGAILGCIQLVLLLGTLSNVT